MIMIQTLSFPFCQCAHRENGASIFSGKVFQTVSSKSKPPSENGVTWVWCGSRSLLPSVQRLFSGMAFSIYEVVRVVSLFTPREKRTQTTYASDKRRERLYKC